MNKTNQIQINFPVPVKLTPEMQILLNEIAGRLCKESCPEGYVYWPAGAGSKITYMPITAEEEKKRGMEFDDSIYSIDCFYREAHPKELERTKQKFKPYIDYAIERMNLKPQPFMTKGKTK